MSILTTVPQPTATDQEEAYRQAAFSQAEFRRCTLLSLDMIRSEIQRLDTVFRTELEPAALALVAQDFTGDLRTGAAELQRQCAAIAGPADNLVTDNPHTTFLIARTARDIQGLVNSLSLSLTASQRILDTSRQAERGRQERAAAYQRELAEKEELHQRRLAGEEL